MCVCEHRGGGLVNVCVCEHRGGELVNVCVCVSIVVED